MTDVCCDLFSTAELTMWFITRVW